jgi:hypothetical protein
MTYINATSALAVATFAAFFSGCSTYTNAPRVDYPVTYQIPVGNTRVNADAGGQNLDVVARQRVAAVPGRRLYFRVASPVDVTMRIYLHDGAPAELLSEMNGVNFTSSVIPDTDELEFTFGVTAANSSGTVQFTLSDRPIPPAVAQIGR